MTRRSDAPEPTRFDETGRLLICGWSTQGRRAVDDLRAMSPDLAITIVCHLEDADVPPVPTGENLEHLSEDPTTAESLRKAGVGRTDAVVLLADRSYGSRPATLDARTILTALTIREIDESVHIIAELGDDEHCNLAADAGIDETIMADRFSGIMLSQSLQSAGLSELFVELFETAAGAILEERPVPSSLVGDPFSRAIAAGSRLGLGAVAGLRRDDDLMLPPSDDVELRDGDLLLSMRRVDSDNG